MQKKKILISHQFIIEIYWLKKKVFPKKNEKTPLKCIWIEVQWERKEKRREEKEKRKEKKRKVEERREKRRGGKGKKEKRRGEKRKPLVWTINEFSYLESQLQQE